MWRVYLKIGDQEDHFCSHWSSRRNRKLQAEQRSQWGAWWLVQQPQLSHGLGGKDNPSDQQGRNGAFSRQVKQNYQPGLGEGKGMGHDGWIAYIC